MNKKPEVKLQERLYSLDTLRGFDMFWIIGFDELIIKLHETTKWDWIEPIANQMNHTQWVGFHFEDLIFPLFMFISGVAIPYALISKKEKGISKINLYKKVFKRMVILVVFGLVFNGILKNGFEGLRMASVLGQIGVSYFLASLVVINTNSIKTRIFWVVGILVGIAMIQLYIPVPGYGAGVLTAEGSINSWIDQRFLPGVLNDGITDPEGLLSIISATSVTLMGAIIGTIIRRGHVDQMKKTTILLVTGTALVLLALSLSPFYPIIKKLWTVPFNILTVGISSILLGLFYFIIDVKQKRNWILFFQVIGLNSITIYMGKRIIDFTHASKFVMGWTQPAFGNEIGSIIIMVGVISLEWLFLYYLYKNKIFLKV